MRSIRTRLALIYTLTIFIILLVLAGLLYFWTLNVLYQADYQFLADQTENLQSILSAKKIDTNMLKEAVRELPLQTEHSIYNYYVRIYDQKRQIKMETPGFSAILAWPQNVLRHDHFNPKRYYWHRAGGEQYLILHARIQNRSHDNFAYIEMALNITDQHAIIKDKNKFAFYLLIGVIIALCLGFLIANRGLKSFALLTQTMEKITSESLGQRIDPHSWPRELRGLSLSFNRMLDRIQHAFDRLNQFSGDLSHELRTPLNNLIGQTEVALAGHAKAHELQAVLESNLEELQRMVQLIENILYLARVENPTQNLQRTRLDAKQEIDNIFSYFEPIACEKYINLTVAGNATIYANPEMFRRLINNLLSNALRYTAEYGQVAITVNSNRKYTVITMRDTGYGIEAAHHAALFDRFYRTDAARAHEAGGIGLGLPIAKSIVELHGGTISLESAVNVGTTITVTLPI